MYSNMNTLTVVGLLAAGVMGQSTSSYSVVLPSSSTSLPVSSVPTTSTTVISTPTPIVTSAPTTVTTSARISAITSPVVAVDQNSTTVTSVLSYFNINVTSVTVVNEFTTVCEEATTLIFDDCTYPATAGQLVVVTNCPCTITTTIPTLTSSLCLPEETAKPAPPPVQVTHATASAIPAPPVTPTRSVAVEKPTNTLPPAIQVAGASPLGNGNTAGFAIAAVAVVFGLF